MTNSLTTNNDDDGVSRICAVRVSAFSEKLLPDLCRINQSSSDNYCTSVNWVSMVGLLGPRVLHILICYLLKIATYIPLRKLFSSLVFFAALSFPGRPNITVNIINERRRALIVCSM